jgi:hypothetical protein
LVGFNDPKVPFPGDYRCVENGHPELSWQVPLEVSVPIMSGITHRWSWFYTNPEQENRCMSVSDLRDLYDRALDCRTIFDLSVGPDHTGQIRKIDEEAIRALARALSDSLPTEASHFLINDDATRINGCANATITYAPPGAWAYRAGQGLGSYSDDAHMATGAGDYCLFQFTGTAAELICPKSSYAGAIDVYVDEVRQTPFDGVDLRSPTLAPRQVVFAIAGLPLQAHTMKIVSRMEGAEVAVDAFRVYSGVPQNLSVENGGVIWMVDSEHLIWTCRPASADSPPLWARVPGTALDIGCGSSVWKTGTDIPYPSLCPRDYSVSVWLGPTYEWRKMVFGMANRVDISDSGAVWVVNNAGEIGYYPLPPESTIFSYTGPGILARDVGCQSARGTVVGKTAPDHSLALWNRPEWETITGEATRLDVASNGDVWVVSGVGYLWQYHAGEWSCKAAGALDVGCGADGEVWYVSVDGTLQRVLEP